MATGARIVCGQRQPIIGDKWTIGPDWEIETFALCADVAALLLTATSVARL